MVVEDAALPGLLVEELERGGGLDVAAGDRPVGAGADDGAEVDAQVLRVLADGGLGLGVAGVGGEHEGRFRRRGAGRREGVAGGLCVDGLGGVHLVGASAGLVLAVGGSKGLGGVRGVSGRGLVSTAAPGRGGVRGAVADEVGGGGVGLGFGGRVGCSGCVAFGVSTRLRPPFLGGSRLNQRRVVDLDDGGAHLDGGHLRHEQRRDGAGVGRRQLDQRLGGLDLDEHVVDLDHVSHGDAPGDDLGLEEALAGVGQQVVALHRSPSPRPKSRFALVCGRKSRFGTLSASTSTTSS